MTFTPPFFFHPIFKAAALLSVLFLGACSESPKTVDNIQKTEKIESPDGFAVFRKFCVNCHGADGKLGLNGAKIIPDSKLTQAEREILIKKGRNLMTPFEALLTEAEVRAVAEYTFSLK